MANRAVFKSHGVEARVPEAAAVNDAGGRAYALDSKHALALFAVTGTFNSTFYVKAEDHLARVKELLDKLGPGEIEFVSKLAVYAREQGFMKDAPAFLAAWVMANDKTGDWFPKVFPRVVKNGKMLGTFWQILNSGVVGRKGVGSRPKRVIANWFNSKDEDFLFRTSIGVAKPGLADVLRAVHPRAETPSRLALYGYLSGRNRPEYANAAAKKGFRAVSEEALPALVRQVEAFKKDPSSVATPEVDFRLLSSLPLTSKQWTDIALAASWQTLRMNLNTLLRHDVFKDASVTKKLADKLRNKEEIARAKVFPYQLLAAYLNHDDGVPRAMIDALHDAMELSVENVPAIEGKLVICPDVSGSMSSPITGHRGDGATSKMRCIDVAALFAVCLLRKNPDARVLPFEGDVRTLKIEPRDSILTNATKLASIGGGSTNCAAPLALLNREKTKVDAVVYISDSESWVDTTQLHGPYARGTGMANEFVQLAVRSPKVKLMAIDITPSRSVQLQSDESVLNVGGFSDEVFKVSQMFLSGQLGKGEWLARIEEVRL